MLPSVCFAAGRFTSTQSSWTGLDHRSRKWMSGQADALTATEDRGPCAEKTRYTTALRETPSPRRSPSLLDFYLSWMSPGFPRLFECISAMKKGSPGSYYAETSVSALTQTARPGEPNEHLSLYRIRRPQETHQLLHQDRRRGGGRTGPLGGATLDPARVGGGANPY